MKRLELYGDSILKGVMYVPEQGRYRLCDDGRFSPVEEQGYAVRNHSRMGATIRKGISSLERAEHYDEDTLVVLEYGGNDCDYDWQQIANDPNGSFLPHTPEGEFLDGYRRAVELAREKGAQVAILSMIPIDAQKYFSWISRNTNAQNILHWLGDVSMLSRWQEYYSRLVEGLAKALHCPLIDTRQVFLQSHRFNDLLCADGIHPTQAGHDLIGEHIAAYLQTA